MTAKTRDEQRWEDWALVREAIGAQPGESLNEAAHRCVDAAKPLAVAQAVLAAEQATTPEARWTCVHTAASLARKLRVVVPVDFETTEPEWRR